MKKHRGFSLTELIMVMAVAGIIAVIFSLVIYSGLDTWLFLRGQKRLMAETSSALRRMVREIKRTRGTTDADILTFTATRYQFRDMNNTLIDFQKVGSNLNRNNAVLLENLPADGLAFVYWDKNGAVTIEKSDIRTIGITLKTASGGNIINLRSAAGLRIR